MPFSMRLVLVRGLLAHRVGELFHLADVAADGRCQRAELEGQTIGVGQPQDEPAADLRQRDAVLEARVHESTVVLEAVVDGVVLAVLPLAAEADVERGDAEVLQERRVVAAGAERRDRQIAAAHGSSALARIAVERDRRAGALLDRAPGLGVGDVARHLVDQALEGVRAAGEEEAAGVAVRVDVDRGRARASSAA